ncbi:hypothetical protein ACT453_29980, partial [Bacillus sp. D-CC]
LLYQYEYLKSLDFLDIRIGTGERPFLVELKVPEQKGYEENPTAFSPSHDKMLLFSLHLVHDAS